MPNNKYEWIAENVEFYNLTVKERVRNKENVWSCRCKCGNTIELHADELLSGYIRSCGCRDVRIERLNPVLHYTLDLDTAVIQPIFKGKQFGKLTLLEKTSRYGWDCLCECGNVVKDVDETFLLNGVTTSCGCDKKEENPSIDNENKEDENEENSDTQENLSSSTVVV